MLGDLSRHISAQTSPAQRQYFHEYSVFYKKVASRDYQNFSKNNRTQGAVEQHFDYLKNVCLKGTRATRIDDFVHQYKNSVNIAEKKFYDSVFHSQVFVKCRLPDPSQPAKRENTYQLPESKFRKRKRRNTGYYSHNFDQKDVKFANKVTIIDKVGSVDSPPVCHSKVVTQTSNTSPASNNDSLNREALHANFANNALKNVRSAAPSIVQPEESRENIPCTRFRCSSNASDRAQLANAVWQEAIVNSTTSGGAW